MDRLPRPTRLPGARCGRAPAAQRGFTLLELLVVLAIVALSVGVVALAIRDPEITRLSREGERLAALLEQARVESRVTGVAVRWVPVNGVADSGRSTGSSAGEAAQFHFVGIPTRQAMPTRWLDPETRAQVVGGAAVVLGPQAILPPQRIVLSLGAQRLELATDGLGAFAAANTAADSAPAAPRTPP
ncbi:MAG: prepilin-type N-terminal cleavage/methylation domain-containing protein [Rubrivivax sp.]